ncbi:hypothetical protein K7G98_17870, partial [Saccharothrix sp. MB29]|nr:hypothetical protein [Saccharothrix sp. MB29]
AQQEADGAAQAPAGPALAQLQSGNAIPPALRGKGLGGRGAQQGLTYTGPSESGDAESTGGAPNQGGSQSGTRKERRAAARAQAKGQRKGPRE